MEIKKFKVQGDTKNTFMDIELDLVIEDDSIGAPCNVLGGEFIISQNGKILVLTNPDWVLTLMDITPEPEIEKPKLEINKTVEIFFETKEIQVKTDCSYEELFYFLQNEWKMAGALMSIPLPCDYTERFKLFTFFDEWNFMEGSLKHLSGGSYSRKTKDGRNI